jgi:hypothetical protein
MWGDFSKWRFNPDNISGVLHQQGRVLLDRDWNDKTRLVNDWQDRAARDVIGAGVLAVPATDPDPFRVASARVWNGGVVVSVQSGDAWADGLSVQLPGNARKRLDATYFEPPIQDVSGAVADIGDGIRDAVVLEVWRESLNAFQETAELYEAALGGPDTSERVLTSMRFRLLRLRDPNDNCRNIIPGLQDDFSKKGKLRATLQKIEPVVTDCPVADKGGYTGFEHFLYRVEIAKVNDSDPNWPMFKWSQFNGGLVGRGEASLSGATKKIRITANDQAIKSSDLNSFYLEVIEKKSSEGYYRVTYGAEVELKDDELVVKAAKEHYKESPLPSGDVFFRLWNGICPISRYPKAGSPRELQDGIRLEFDQPDGTNYQDGDYWTFTVRAGDISHAEPLMPNQAPEGVHYHRVPLAILNWNASKDVTYPGSIKDCRDIFRPLARQSVCCTLVVGDGESSFGDFNSIEEALGHLPDSGGQICLLPGVHETNAFVANRGSITIKGCGKKTLVKPRANKPIFHIVDSLSIVLEEMDIATLDGTAILIEKTEEGVLDDIEVRSNRIQAFENAVRVEGGQKVRIHHNRINMLDKEGAGVGIYMLAEDSVIERNVVTVVPAEAEVAPKRDPGTIDPGNPVDDCFRPKLAYGNRTFFRAYVNNLFLFNHATFFRPFKYSALGGIQIAGGSERVRILENRIAGGAGNGISLGTGFDVSMLTGRTVPPGEEETEHYVDGRRPEVAGQTLLNGNPVAGVSLSFENEETGQQWSEQSDENGYFVFKSFGEQLRVRSTDPRYEIKKVTVVEQYLTYAPSYTAHLIELTEVEEEETTDIEDIFAFLYGIQIEANHILKMGLSGIGIPRVVIPDQSSTHTVGRTKIDPLLVLLALLGNPVLGLRIDRNRIHDCLQNPLDEETRADVTKKGLGGISLGMCGDVHIFGNRIENNGTLYGLPTCGIYITYVERAELCHNLINDNGQGTPTVDSATVGGKRGGIIANASSLSLLNIVEGSGTAISTSRAAIRVHDNDVDQPAGLALGLVLIGPASVLNNRLNSDACGTGTYDSKGGALFICNLGGLPSSGTSVAGRKTAASGLPDGYTLVNNNQVRTGPDSRGQHSIQIFALYDDISFVGNQCRDLKAEFPEFALLPLTQYPILTHAVLFGETVRASDNRFSEENWPASATSSGKPTTHQISAGLLSLLSISLKLNNTTDNQGDHCIRAYRLSFLGSSIYSKDRVVERDNLEVIQFESQYCSQVEEWIMSF